MNRALWNRGRDIRALGLVLALACAGVSPVHAQYTAYTTLNMSAVNAMTTSIQNAVQIQEAERRLALVSKMSSGAKPNAPAAPQTGFRPGPHRLLLQSFARRLSNKPDEVKALNTAFTEGFKAYEAEARRLGKSNNVGMALTYLIGVCSMVHSGQEPSEKALLDLQAKADLALGDSVKRLKDSERQQLYESMILMATLPLAGYSVAVEQNDSRLLETYRTIAAQTLKSVLGLGPERLKFTASGLEIR